MKDLKELTEVPPVLAAFYPTVEELREEMGIVVPNAARSENLMASLFSQMTSVESDAIKAEIKGISKAMNALMVKRFGPPQPAMLAAIMGFAHLMGEYMPKTDMTPEKAVMLRATGALAELASAKSASPASQ